MAEQMQQIALVTGAASGMGLEIATTLAEQGIAAYLCSRRHDAGAATVKELPDHGLGVDGCSCDVRSLEQIQNFVRADVELDPIGILVDNAGRPGSGDTSLLADELWCDVIETSLTSVLRVTEEVLTADGMLVKGRGRIIDIASTGGRQGVIHAAPYSAPKHGVVGFTRPSASGSPRPVSRSTPSTRDSSRPRWWSGFANTTPLSVEWTRPRPTLVSLPGCRSVGTSSRTRWPQWSST